MAWVGTKVVRGIVVGLQEEGRRKEEEVSAGTGAAG